MKKGFKQFVLYSNNTSLWVKNDMVLIAQTIIKHTADCSGYKRRVRQQSGWFFPVGRANSLLQFLYPTSNQRAEEYPKLCASCTGPTDTGTPLTQQHTGNFCQ